MTERLKSPAELVLPQWMQDEIDRLLRDLPPRVSRRRGADIVKQNVFEVSHRTMERWPLAIRHLNGQAHLETLDLLIEAFTRLAAAPVLATGRQAA